MTVLDNPQSHTKDKMSGPTDGRTLRRSRNRDAVIAALLGLIRDGRLNPGAAEIAERAGVSHRSVFRYFDDLSDLVSTAIRQDFLDAQHLLEIPDMGQGSINVRVANLVDSRVALYEQLRGTALVARIRAGSLPDIDAERVTVAQHKRNQLREHFANEFAELSSSDSERILDTCLVLTSFDSFDLHERMLGHDSDAINASWSTSLVALFSC